MSKITNMARLASDFLDEMEDSGLSTEEMLEVIADMANTLIDGDSTLATQFAASLDE